MPRSGCVYFGGFIFLPYIWAADAAQYTRCSLRSQATLRPEEHHPPFGKIKKNEMRAHLVAHNNNPLLFDKHDDNASYNRFRRRQIHNRR